MKAERPHVALLKAASMIFSVEIEHERVYRPVVSSMMLPRIRPVFGSYMESRMSPYGGQTLVHLYPKGASSSDWAPPVPVATGIARCHSGNSFKKGDRYVKSIGIKLALEKALAKLGLLEACQQPSQTGPDGFDA